MNSKKKLTGPGAIVLCLRLVLAEMLIALPLWWVWNLTVPGACGFSTINYFQALGLRVLAVLVFKLPVNIWGDWIEGDVEKVRF